MTENQLSRIIFNAGLEVHKQLGPGLLESAYEECLFYELQKQNITVEKQKPLPLFYKGIKMDIGYRLDILVENKVIIEVKSVTDLCNIHLAQTLTYLKLTGCKLGMLINFNEVLFKHGVQRVVNNL